MNNSLKHLPIVLIIVISIASMFAILPNLNSLQQQSVYAASLKTSDLKQDIKQHVNQDNVCHRSDGCEQANDNKQITGNDNTAAGYNDQSENIQHQQQPAVSPTSPTASGNGTTPTPQTGSLLVTKDVKCLQGFTCPQPSDFTMHITGAPGNNNPNPSSFAGSSGGTNVAVNLGTYNVIEDVPTNAPVQLKLVQHFGSGCSGSINTAGENKKCDVLNEYVQKTYIFLNKWGSEGTSDGQFKTPVGIAVNPSTGNVFVVEFDNERVQVFDSSGNFITKFGSHGGGNGQFNLPAGIAVNPSTGNVFVVERNNDRVQVFDSSGNFITKFGTGGTGDGQFLDPNSAAVNPSTGNVFVTDTGHNRVQVFDSSGNFITKFGTGGTGDGQFNAPVGIAVNPSTGNVFVVDFNNNRVQVFDSSGNFITKFGTGGTGDGQFDGPRGIAVNPSTGNVFVTDTGHNRVQVFDSSGNFITKFGTGGTGDGQFDGPRGIAVNPSTGNVYIADTGHNRVQVFTLEP